MLAYPEAMQLYTCVLVGSCRNDEPRSGSSGIVRGMLIDKHKTNTEIYPKLDVACGVSH